MNKFYSTILIILLSFGYKAQVEIISQFTWNDRNASVLEADVGPNGESASSSATISPNGANGNGLNPGLPKQDIDFYFPNDNYFDRPSMGFQIDFQREESDGIFFSRDGFEFGMRRGNLRVEFTLENPDGSTFLVQSGNQFSIPNDDHFRTYQFAYIQSRGEAFLAVDGQTVWSYQGTPGLPMAWGNDALRIGEIVDASGRDKTVFDNLFVAEIEPTALPIELLDIQLTNNLDGTVDLHWSTASEINNEWFEIQRSRDGQNWIELTTMLGAGNSVQVLRYTFTDENPLPGISYYRLKQIDYDGQFTFSPVIANKSAQREQVVVYPNPTRDLLYVKNVQSNLQSAQLIGPSGQATTVPVVQSGPQRWQMNLTSLPSGIYFLNIDGQAHRIVKQ